MSDAAGGAGLILRDLLSLGATVSVVATGDDARLRQEAGAQAVAGSLDDLPARDGLVVATPTITHADVIEALLPRGMPIYCEKPLCDDAGRARRLAAAGRDRLVVMDKWRYHLGVLALAAIVRSGELGRVWVAHHARRLRHGHPTPIVLDLAAARSGHREGDFRPVAAARCRGGGPRG